SHYQSTGLRIEQPQQCPPGCASACAASAAGQPDCAAAGCTDADGQTADRCRRHKIEFSGDSCPKTAARPRPYGPGARSEKAIVRSREQAGGRYVGSTFTKNSL